MRFVITGEWTRNTLLKMIIICFMLYILAFWLTSALMFFAKMDLSASSIVEYYRGSEQKFIPPRTYLSMLEVTHMHLFAMAILILTLTHLLLFVPISKVMKVILICLTFFSAISNEAASWLVRFAHPSFAYLKLISFTVLQLTILILIG